MNCQASSVYALALIVATPCAWAGSPTSVAAVEPVVLFENGQVAGCGFRARVPAQPLTADVTAFRDGAQTIFVLSAHWPDATAKPQPIINLQLVTATHDTNTSFPKPTASTAGRFESRGRLEGFSGASFIQGIMVGGGTFTITAKDGRTLSFALPAPMPPDVRSTYLMCAGDLVRPEP